jgi:Tol biopolymer transport system component
MGIGYVAFTSSYWFIIISNGKKMKKRISLFALLVITISLIIVGMYLFFERTDNIPTGNIALSIGDQRVENTKIIILSPNGDKVKYVGDYHGSPTFSPDGKYLAIGCKDELCILNLTYLFSANDEFINLGGRESLAYQLKIQNGCYSKEKFGSPDYSGLLSVSWSPDGNRLIVVCGAGTYKSQQSVCIVSLDNEMECWGKEEANDVYRAVWAPVDEGSILISGTEIQNGLAKVQIADTTGKVKQYLTDGWSAEWSPKGDQIAFISTRDYGNFLNIINADGSDLHEITFPFYIYFNCNWYVTNCRISWSPDGRYLIFPSSNNPGAYTVRLYQYDIKTGKIVVLLDPLLFTYSAEPDWGPPISE